MRRAAFMPLVSLAIVLGGIVAAGAVAGGPPGPGLSGPSVSPGPFSATVSWSMSSGGSVVVEYGVDDRYGVWADPVVTTEPGTGSVTLTGLEPATRYAFRLTANSRPIVGKTIVTGAFVTAPYPTAASAAITGGGGAALAPPPATDKAGDRQITRSTSAVRGSGQALLTVNGAPIFPRVVWRQCPWAWQDSLAAGVNVFLGAGCNLADTALSALAGRALSTLDVGLPGAGVPGVIGFHQPDEPDWSATTPNALPRVSAAGRVTFLTVTDKFSVHKAPPKGGRGIYAGLFASADVIGFDSYPLEERCQPDTIDQVYDLQRELVAQVPGKPTFQWIESGPMEKCFRYDPTPAIVKAETWLAIAGGAVGIGYFPGLWEPPMRDAARSINRDIVALAPALLGEVGTGSADSKSKVRVGVRRHGGATYVIAVNPRLSSTQARISAAGIGGRTLTVFGEGRTVEATGGAIVDTFAPLAVHIYVLPPTAP